MADNESSPAFETAEDLARSIARAVAQLALHEWQWKAMGFKGPPRRGKWFNRFVSAERLAQETFLLREFAVASLAMGVGAIREVQSDELARRVQARVIDLLVGTEGIWDAFRYHSPEEFCEYLIDGVGQYPNDPDSAVPVFAKRAHTAEGNPFRPAWLVGIARIFVEPGAPMPFVHYQLRSDLKNVAIRPECEFQHPELLDRLPRSPAA